MRKIAAGLATLALAGIAPAAHADTPNCASRAEYDNLRVGLSPTQVYSRFDIYGTLVGDGGGEFRRSYRSCWAPGEREVVIVYSYDTNGAVDWFVRDA